MICETPVPANVGSGAPVASRRTVENVAGYAVVAVPPTVNRSVPSGRASRLVTRPPSASVTPSNVPVPAKAGSGVPSGNRRMTIGTSTPAFGREPPRITFPPRSMVMAPSTAPAGPAWT